MSQAMLDTRHCAQQVRKRSRVASAFLLFCLFYVVAAASHAGFMGKWAFRDDWNRIPPGAPAVDGEHARGISIEAVLDGRAPRPWAYRQLLPLVANAAQDWFPGLASLASSGWMSEAVSPGQTFTRAGSSDRPAIRFRYLVTYYLSFGSLLLALFTFRRVLLDLGIANGAEVAAPCGFLLAFPYLQTVGGYAYDNVELLALALAVLLAMRGRTLGLVALAVPATLNKETFILFLPTLLPLLSRSLPMRRALARLALVGGTAVLVEVFTRARLAGAGGGALDFQLFDNLRRFLDPKLYLWSELTYGLVGPSQMSVAVILAAGLVVARGYPACPPAVRQHVLLASAINLPLYLLFCQAGEMRNLSLTFPGFVVLAGFALHRAHTAADPAVPAR